MKPYFASFLVIISLSFTSCQNKHSVENLEIEKLQNKLGENAKTLQIDISLFESRVNEINQNLDLLKKEYTDTLSLELGMQFDKYKAMRKIYDKQVDAYSACIKEQMELETQLTHLKEDLVNGLIGKQEFKNYFQQEKADIEALVLKSADVSKRLYEVEPEYNRLSTLVYDVIDSLE
jgi:TolA-binding protein